MQEQPGLLKSAFAHTDTIEYGPFRVHKQPGASWRDAHASVDNREITLSPAEKRYLALLISQRGKVLTLDMLAPELEGSNPAYWYIKAFQEDDFVEQRGATKELSNTVKVTVSHIKKKMEKQGVAEETRDLISASNPDRKSGQKGTALPGLRAGYRIYLPFPSV
jgi:hypothetical protein